MFRHLLQSLQCEVQGIAVAAVVLAELVKVVAQQLADQEEVLLVVEVVVQLQHAVLVCVAASVDVLQKLDLVERLVEVVLRVLNDLYAHLRVVWLGCSVVEGKHTGWFVFRSKHCTASENAALPMYSRIW